MVRFASYRDGKIEKGGKISLAVSRDEPRGARGKEAGVRAERRRTVRDWD